VLRLIGASSELETYGCLVKVSSGDLLWKVYLQVEKKEGGNECLSLHGALYLGPQLSCMALMGNFSCFTSLAAYHVLWPCFKAIFLFIPSS
jgi:hypothetical protein